MLDKLPAEVRHSLIALAAALVAWATTTVPALDLPQPLPVLLGVVVTMAATYLTPLTKQYGIGFEPAPVKKAAK
jgi:hypothetical protein